MSFSRSKRFFKKEKEILPGPADYKVNWGFFGCIKSWEDNWKNISLTSGKKCSPKNDKLQRNTTERISFRQRTENSKNGPKKVVSPTKEMLIKKTVTQSPRQRNDQPLEKPKQMEKPTEKLPVNISVRESFKERKDEANETLRKNQPIQESVKIEVQHPEKPKQVESQTEKCQMNITVRMEHSKNAAQQSENLTKDVPSHQETKKEELPRKKIKPMTVNQFFKHRFDQVNEILKLCEEEERVVEPPTRKCPIGTFLDRSQSTSKKQNKHVDAKSLHNLLPVRLDYFKEKKIIEDVMKLPAKCFYVNDSSDSDDEDSENTHNIHIQHSKTSKRLFNSDDNKENIPSRRDTEITPDDEEKILLEMCDKETDFSKKTEIVQKLSVIQKKEYEKTVTNLSDIPNDQSKNDFQ